MADKIPSQYRLTFQEQTSSVWGWEGGVYSEKSTFIKPPLAFSTVYDPNTKGFIKRKETQDVWAYGTLLEEDCSIGRDGHFIKDGVYWKRYREWQHRYVISNESHWINEIIPNELQPRIIDNVPLEGFRIQKSVSRYSTSNKLWRILDPRGFELEISTANLEDLLLEGSINKGLISGTCIWKTAKMLVRV